MSIQNSPFYNRLMELCSQFEATEDAQLRASLGNQILEEARALARTEKEQSLIAPVISLDLRRAKTACEKNMIETALNQTHGNKSQAARLLGITREGLRKAMKKAA